MRAKQYAFDPIRVGDRVRFVDESARAYHEIIGQEGIVKSITPVDRFNPAIQAVNCHDILDVCFDDGVLSSAYAYRFKLLGARMSVDIVF